MKRDAQGAQLVIKPYLHFLRPLSSMQQENSNMPTPSPKRELAWRRSFFSTFQVDAVSILAIRVSVHNHIDRTCRLLRAQLETKAKIKETGCKFCDGGRQKSTSEAHSRGTLRQASILIVSVSKDGEIYTSKSMCEFICYSTLFKCI